MNALLVLYAGNLSSQAFEPVFNGKNAIELCIEQAAKFPKVSKTILAVSDNTDLSFINKFEGIEIVQCETWTKRSLLEKIAEHQAGLDLAYFTFADCPFLDPCLTDALEQRHTKYAAEYTYADGWPYGLTPELLSPGTSAILSKILGEDDGAVERDLLFSVIQKDINAFDIEAEISAADLRCHRINLCADTKRNLLLLNNFINAAGSKIPCASDIERIVTDQPEILRTLPIFYPIQVYGGCPQKCGICPYPLNTDVLTRKDFLEIDKFKSLLEKIIAFSGDAVIDLSLWGELSLHPQKDQLIQEVLSHPQLALVIETSGLGWKNEELDRYLQLSINAKKEKRINYLPPLSWIVSLDTVNPQRYTQMRGTGFAEANDTCKKLLSLFPNDCYAQAVRVKGEEDDTEKFYRHWKDLSPNGEKNVIIQKYNDFCKTLEKKQASDISPVIRQCCWHIMRDFPILIDGTVPLCREDISVLKGQNENNRILGNVFTDSLEKIWQNGNSFYIEQCKKNYSGICSDCDEYYTYNF
ncbi:MAG: spiro-SPASM protein [Treponema sp.]|nr:spiro-SPASM protein [Treponema sp.]